MSARWWPPKSVVRRPAARRWALVAGGVALTCALPAIIGALPSTGPATGAAGLRARILASGNGPYEGYAQSDGALAIPSLPGLSDLTAVLDGATRMRVWHASASRWRVDVMSGAAERDTYTLPAGTFVWDSGSRLLAKIVGTGTFRLPRAADFTPPALAARLLRDAGPHSRISGLAARRVAGKAAAGLRLVPAGPATTIGHVDIWADAGTGLPLQVEITGRGGARPALMSRFFQVSSTRPGRGVLTPKRGPGTGFTVTNAAGIAAALHSLAPERLPASLAGRPRAQPPRGFEEIGAYGSGLATFAVLPLTHRVGSRALNAARRAAGVPVDFPHGAGVVLSTALLTVVVAHSYVSRDTFLLAGLVDGKLLQAAAAQLTARPDADF